MKQSLILFLFVFLAQTSLSIKPAHALDKRLKLLFKTSAYGAAAGGIIGLGTFAMGIGNYRNVLMGASSGLYAGIALAAFIVATPEEKKGYRHGPRRPVGEEDWEQESNDEDVLKEHVPLKEDSEDDQSMRQIFLRYQLVNTIPQTPYQVQNPSLWSPVLTWNF